MSTNPYQSSFQEDPPIAPSKDWWHLILYSIILGLIYGMVFGGLAAALVGIAVSGLVVQFGIQPGDIGDPISNALFCSVAGAILGGMSYAVASLLIGIWASRSSQRFRAWMPMIAAVTCGGIGMLGGAACGVLLSGTGFDGVPISLLVLVVSSAIGLGIGLIGGTFHGVHMNHRLKSIRLTGEENY